MHIKYQKWIMTSSRWKPEGENESPRVLLQISRHRRLRRRDFWEHTEHIVSIRHYSQGNQRDAVSTSGLFSMTLMFCRGILVRSLSNAEMTFSKSATRFFNSWNSEQSHTFLPGGPGKPRSPFGPDLPGRPTAAAAVENSVEAGFPSPQESEHVPRFNVVAQHATALSDTKLAITGKSCFIISSSCRCERNDKKRA